MSFFEFLMAANIQMISPRPILLIVVEKTHSCYYFEAICKMAPERIGDYTGADHVDLYDKKVLIAFDKLEAFF